MLRSELVCQASPERPILQCVPHDIAQLVNDSYPDCCCHCSPKGRRVPDSRTRRAPVTCEQPPRASYSLVSSTSGGLVGCGRATASAADKDGGDGLGFAPTGASSDGLTLEVSGGRG